MIARNEPSRTVALVAYPDANLLDISGPLQVFATTAEQLAAKQVCETRAYRPILCSVAGGPVRTSSGIVLESQPLGGLDRRGLDTVLVAGGHGAWAAAADPQLCAWVRSVAGVRRIGSICTGTFVLGAAGLLDGRRAATHWDYCDQLQAENPAAQIEPDAIFVEDNGLWTSAGVTAGMDMALAMVEQDWGREVALLVARRLVFFLKRPGGQSQFSAPLAAQAAEGPLAKLLDWIIENPTADLRTSRLAEKAAMSDRTLFRTFTQVTGRAPADFVEEVRLEAARRLLEQTYLDTATVAGRAGFRSAERMRRTFVRRLGVAPSDYRDRFRSATYPPVDPLASAALRVTGAA